MYKLNHTLRASTLVETLVTMITAGIVFLSVTEGLRLFTRLQTRSAEALSANGRMRDGYLRLESLAAGADSILAADDGLEVYRGGRSAALQLRDSALVCRSGAFRDTLLTGVASLRLCGTESDTVEAVFARFKARFPVANPPSVRYGRALEEIENGYGYEP